MTLVSYPSTVLPFRSSVNSTFSSHFAYRVVSALIVISLSASPMQSSVRYQPRKICVSSSAGVGRFLKGMLLLIEMDSTIPCAEENVTVLISFSMECVPEASLAIFNT